MITGKHLKATRLRAGLTQKQLADKTGFHRLAVGYWENKGGTFTARCGAPAAFVKALGVKPLPSPIGTRAAWGFTDVENARIEQELARLGASRIANNLNQLAHQANIGSLIMDENTCAQIDETCAHVRLMRDELVSALGLIEG